MGDDENHKIHEFIPEYGNVVLLVLDDTHNYVNVEMHVYNQIHVMYCMKGIKNE